MQTSSAACGSLSFLTPIGYQSGSCGYCKSEETSQRTPDSRASYYARSKSLCPAQYQTLMDRGWRRSGSLLYIPDASRSCCPHYTIRLPASEFKPSRDQRQALNRWNRYILGDKYMKEARTKYPATKADKKRTKNEFDLLGTVHESEQVNIKSDVHPSDHRFEVTLELDNFTEEKYALFDNYQRHVHHEDDSDISRAGFKRFLCSSPLHRHTELDGKKLGSFHQCYRLDGRLIAMGVLDLLPHAVSGVYFLYHNDLEAWSLGKLSALREAALASEAGYEYYYMGYYIHACRKMRYKGDYRPQYVLDYHSHEWNVLDDEMRALMDKRKYASMSKEQRRRDRAAEKRQLNKEKEANTAVSSLSSSSNPEQPYPDDGGTDDEAELDAEHILHPKPLDAMHSGLSLLSLSMPGVLSPAELESQDIDLDAVRVFLGMGGVHEMQDIVSWHTGSITDPTSLKGIVAEFAATVGPKVAKEIIVDLSR